MTILQTFPSFLGACLPSKSWFVDSAQIKRFGVCQTIPVSNWCSLGIQVGTPTKMNEAEERDTGGEGRRWRSIKMLTMATRGPSGLRSPLRESLERERERGRERNGGRARRRGGCRTVEIHFAGRRVRNKEGSCSDFFKNPTHSEASGQWIC